MARCFPSQNSLGLHVGGLVKHSGEPWQPVLGQSSCKPDRFSQSQPLYRILALSSRDVEGLSLITSGSRLGDDVEVNGEDESSLFCFFAAIL